MKEETFSNGVWRTREWTGEEREERIAQGRHLSISRMPAPEGVEEAWEVTAFSFGEAANPEVIHHFRRLGVIPWMHTVTGERERECSETKLCGLVRQHKWKLDQLEAEANTQPEAASVTSCLSHVPVAFDRRSRGRQDERFFDPDLL